MVLWKGSSYWVQGLGLGRTGGGQGGASSAGCIEVRVGARLLRAWALVYKGLCGIERPLSACVQICTLWK